MGFLTTTVLLMLAERLNLGNTLHPPAGMKCCEFEDRLMNAYQYEATHLDIYEPTGPNSNNFVQNIVGRAGGTAEFPSNAFGAVGIFDGLSASPLGQLFWTMIQLVPSLTALLLIDDATRHGRLTDID